MFDQSAATDDPHFLAINEEDLPGRYRPLLRRLQKAMADPTVRQTMDAEDDLIEEFKDYQRLISSKEAIIQAKEQLIEEKNMAISNKEKAILEKEQTIMEKEQTISEKEQTISEKEQTISEKEQTISEKEQTILEKQKQIERVMVELYTAGTEINRLAGIFGLSEAAVEEILHKNTAGR